MFILSEEVPRVRVNAEKVLTLFYSYAIVKGMFLRLAGGVPAAKHLQKGDEGMSTTDAMAEREDLFRVLVRRNGQSRLEDFYFRFCSNFRLELKGARLTGRFGIDGSDRVIDVSQIVFKDEKAFRKFFEFIFGMQEKSPLERLGREASRADLDAAAAIEAERRRQLASLLKRHPILRIDSRPFNLMQPSARMASAV